MRIFRRPARGGSYARSPRRSRLPLAPLLILALLPAVFAVVAYLLFGVFMLLTSPQATLGLFKPRRQSKPPLTPEATTANPPASAIEAAGTEGAEAGR